MSKIEQKRYFSWFMDAISEREIELTNVVKATVGFETWIPDHSPASLNVLGEWFAGQVELRRRSNEEVDRIKASLVFPIPVPPDGLTDKTFSLARDVGMYLGQVFMLNHQNLRWDRALGSKRFVDYGQPVLLGLGSVPLNPMRLCVVAAYGIAAGTCKGTRLSEVYEYWSKRL